jgi:localization factor PodJL
MEQPPAAAPPIALATPTPSSPEQNYQLAMRLREGDGMARDESRALTLLTLAAEGDHADAQFKLAEAYANGEGVQKEVAWATMWYGRAAAIGHTESQYRLALAYANATGIDGSFIDAFKWATIAAAAGHDEAGKLRASLSRRMIREEIAPATEAATRWHPAAEHPNPDEPLIRYVQYSLRQLGYDAGPVDGVVGARTRKAIKSATEKETVRTETITPALVDWLRTRQRAKQNGGHPA